MNTDPMHDDIHAHDAPPAGADAAADASASDAERQLAEELRRFGRLLADTMRAAANTPEAQSLREEMRSGTTALRDELDETMAATRETTTRVAREYQSSGLPRLRADLARALRAVNRAMESVADSVEPAPGAEAPAPDAVPAAPETGMSEVPAATADDAPDSGEAPTFE